tara:strand:- start:579 stop:920 length:342 start_codon:yes stop_codon:yes gene_type:complete
MKINNIILIVGIALVGLSCQTIKDGLSGSKSENSDEFLVQKKNPLVLPPKFLELPKPKDEEYDDEDEDDEKNLQSEEEIDIKKKLGIKNESVSQSSKTRGTAEDFVLKNIKNN